MTKLPESENLSESEIRYWKEMNLNDLYEKFSELKDTVDYLYKIIGFIRKEYNENKQFLDFTEAEKYLNDKGIKIYGLNKRYANLYKIPYHLLGHKIIFFKTEIDEWINKWLNEKLK